MPATRVCCSALFVGTHRLLGGTGRRAKGSTLMSQALSIEIVAEDQITGQPTAEVPIRSLIGLHAASFFLAELTGVVVPFFNEYLKAAEWRYDAIGAATALAGTGALLMQTPAGALLDRFRARRAILAAASLAVGICHGALPAVPALWWFVVPLLVTAGMAKTFFKPALGALAIALVGHRALNRTIGINECSNHLGNIAAAACAMALVSVFSVSAVFYVVLLVSILAVASLSLIRLPTSRATLHATERGHLATDQANWPSRLSDARIALILATATLFHFANAPTMPMVALYIKHLGGSDWQVAAVVLVAQAVMVPVAIATAELCDRWGRKPTLAIGFVVLPLRIFVYSLATSPNALVALQALDGIGAGVFGVAVVAICADLGQKNGRFNTLSGMIATAGGVGGVCGTLVSGVLMQQLGFAATFQMLAAIALLAAIVFVGFMRETRPIEQSNLADHELPFSATN